MKGFDILSSMRFGINDSRTLVRGVILAAAFVGLAGLRGAHAEGGSLCRPLADMKASAIAHNARWTVLSPDQFEFVRGVFVLNPQTAPGMPFGESAALVQFGDPKDGGVIVFQDGEKACQPMPIPPALIAMLLDLQSVHHEGEGM